MIRAGTEYLTPRGWTVHPQGKSILCVDNGPVWKTCDDVQYFSNQLLYDFSASRLIKYSCDTEHFVSIYKRFKDTQKARHTLAAGQILDAVANSVRPNLYQSVAMTRVPDKNNNTPVLKIISALLHFSDLYMDRGYLMVPDLSKNTMAEQQLQALADQSLITMTQGGIDLKKVKIHGIETIADLFQLALKHAAAVRQYVFEHHRFHCFHGKSLKVRNPLFRHLLQAVMCVAGVPTQLVNNEALYLCKADPIVRYCKNIVITAIWDDALSLSVSRPVIRYKGCITVL